MSDLDFDSALITAALAIAAERGWRHVSVAAAAREAGLSLSEARARFPSRARILMRLGVMADQAVLTDVPAEGTVRDRLFDLLMRRYDAFQAHRAGLIAIMRALPCDPATAVILACATRRSMRWMLNAAGAETGGLRGELKVRGLIGVWLWGLRAWEKDDSEDLTTTMAAVDTALSRAERAAEWLEGRKVRATVVADAGDDVGEDGVGEDGADVDMADGADDDAGDDQAGDDQAGDDQAGDDDAGGDRAGGRQPGPA